MNIQKMIALSVLLIVNACMIHCCENGWNTAVDAGQGSNLNIAASDDNSATAIFDATVNSTAYIAAVYFIPDSTKSTGGSWSIENGGSLDIISGPGATEATMGWNLQGQRLAAWTRNGQIEFSIYQNGFWTVPEVISVPGKLSDKPKAVMNQLGAIYLAWRGSDNSGRNIQVIYRDPSGTWSSIQTFVPVIQPTEVTLSINDDGNGIAGGVSTDGDVYVNLTSAPNIWGTNQKITNAALDNSIASDLRVLRGNFGGSVAVWGSLESGTIITRSRYILPSAPGVWNPDLSLPPYPVGNGGFPSMAINTLTGNSIVTFGSTALHSVLYLAQSGYQQGQSKQINPTGQGGPSDTAANILDHAVAVWPIATGSGVLSNCYTSTTGWQDSSKAQTVYTGKAEKISTVINNKDRSFAGGQTIITNG